MDILAIERQTDLETFLTMVFPPGWGGVTRVIIESGAAFAIDGDVVKWAPRWSRIPRTVKRGRTPEIAAVKSVLYRTHDALHQLWGIPVPHIFNTDEFYLYKRAQMCGEVAVLLLTELVIGSWISEQCPVVRPYLEQRCGVPMYRDILRDRSLPEIAARFDGILHVNTRPRWVRESEVATKFVNYYGPMLERDRQEIDHNWNILHNALGAGFSMGLCGAPETRYDPTMDGQELTVWMIHDFEHLRRSGTRVDRALALFNRQRRDAIRLPDQWRQVND